jgi:hypothetical protein
MAQAIRPIARPVAVLRDQRLIETRDGRLYPAQRRRKKLEPAPPPSFWEAGGMPRSPQFWGVAA